MVARFEFVEGLLQTLDGHDEVDAERGAAEIEICLELLRRGIWVLRSSPPAASTTDFTRS